MATRWTTWAGYGLVASALVGGCASERTLTSRCGDGVHEAGEICLGPEIIEYDLDFEVHALRAADFTGDSISDLLVMGVGPPALTGILMIGDETSPLLEARDPLVSGCSAHPVTGSLDPDGITDLLVAACEPALIVFHGSKSGQFELGPVLEVPAATRTSSLHDANGDGIDDLLVLGGRPEESASLSILPGTGEGTFGVGIRTDIKTTEIPGYNPNGMALTDLDNDGLSDVILVEFERTGGLTIARGQPGGSFATPEPFAKNIAARAMTLADLDEDGRDDLIVANTKNDHIVTLRSDGQGLVEVASLSASPIVPRTMTPYDLDRDGHLDILVTDPELTSVVVLQGGEGGGLTGQVWVLWFDAPVDQLAVADVNGDGVRDLIAGTFSRNSVTVHLSSP